MVAPASVDLVNCEGNVLTLVATLRARDTARSLGCRVMNAARQPPGLGLLLGLCIALVVTLVLATVCAQHSSSVRPFQSGQRRFFPVLTGAHRDGAALLRRSVAAASDAVPASQAQPGSEISRPTSNSTPPGAGNNQTGPAPVLELDLRQGIPNATMAKYHRQVLQYLGSTAFLSWRAELQHLPERRGILVAVGGAKLVSSLVVMLKVPA
ncbi:hypothetical protein QJQ45_026170 [Haematococcus lacustris]|nr:hypothetical protein QJQ45_026170 [Haematococcus lacustris]